MTLSPHFVKLHDMADFGCNFNEEGYCKRWNKIETDIYATETLKKAKRGGKNCCSSCFSSRGYLSIENEKKYKSIISELFDDKLGFWRQGVGCTLPKNIRSYVCLSYNCIRYDEYNYTENSFVKYVITLTKIFENGARRYRCNMDTY